MFGALGITPTTAQAVYQAALNITCQKVAERVTVDPAYCKSRADELYKSGKTMPEIVDTIAAESSGVQASAGRNWLIWGSIGAVALIGVVLLVKK